MTSHKQRMIWVGIVAMGLCVSGAVISPAVSQEFQKTPIMLQASEIVTDSLACILF